MCLFHIKIIDTCTWVYRICASNETRKLRLSLSFYFCVCCVHPLLCLFTSPSLFLTLCRRPLLYSVPRTISLRNVLRSHEMFKTPSVLSTVVYFRGVGGSGRGSPLSFKKTEEKSWWANLCRLVWSSRGRRMRGTEKRGTVWPKNTSVTTICYFAFRLHLFLTLVWHLYRYPIQ